LLGGYKRHGKRSFSVEMPNKQGSSPRRERNLERDQEILKYRAQGLSLQDIGRIYGISRERVRQILLKFAQTESTEGDKS
jgi:DNA-binding NarL/FixJ family response regulator